MTQRRTVLHGLASALLIPSFPLLPELARAAPALWSGDFQSKYWFRTDIEPVWRQITVERRDGVLSGFLDGLKWPAQTVASDACFVLLTNFSCSILTRSPNEEVARENYNRAVEAFHQGLYARLGRALLMDLTVTADWIEAS